MPRPVASDCEYLDVSAWHGSELGVELKNAVTDWRVRSVSAGSFARGLHETYPTDLPHWTAVIHAARSIDVRVQQPTDSKAQTRPLLDVASALSVAGVALAAIVASVGLQFGAVGILVLSVLLGAFAYFGKLHSVRA